jgi:small subunit ribosomal protein S1
VENPREVVAPGDEIKVKILEIDSERRRLSLSVKRVEGQVLPSELRGDGPGTVEPLEPLEEGEEGEQAFGEDPGAPAPEASGEAGDLDDVPELGLSEDVFADNQQNP